MIVITNILIVLFLSYSGICGFMYFYQSKFIFFPVQEIKTDPKDIGLSFNEVWINVTQNIKINGWYVPSRNPKGTVLYFHGNGGNISHRLNILMLLNRFNLNTYIFDYQGYGKSDGTPSEKNTYEDAEAVWKYVVHDLKVQPETIVVWGQSLGGAVASRLALNHLPGALVLESTFTSLRDVAGYHYPMLPSRFLLMYNYNTLSIINKITCPKLFIHSPMDEIIPYIFGKKLYETAEEPKYFAIIKGDHNQGYIESGDLYTSQIKRFLDKVLK